MINSTLEKKLRDHILPELEKGRVAFDRPHTEAVVHWMKYLLKHVGPHPRLDPTVLITAAYAHDWGYIGLFDGVDKTDLATIHKMKPLHMERGSQLIGTFISTELKPWFTSAQRKRVMHLVAIHDKVEAVKAIDEVLLMEADTLGMLDVERVRPTFSREDNDVFLDREIRRRRLVHFRHESALVIAEKLATARQQWYDRQKQTANRGL